MYVSEKERFNIRHKSEVDFQAFDKQMKFGTQDNKIFKIKTHEGIMGDKNFMKDLVIEEKINYSLLQRSKNMLKYENVSLFCLLF